MKVIEVNSVSKKYKLGVLGGKTLREDVSAWLAKKRGMNNPNLQIGEEAKRTDSEGSFWALKDVSFSVEQGEILGIVGRNGAGKSTLLKLLSQITYPSSGEIKIKGRIASLLEVGTGFHPELTGRENIFLNGAILGMSRKEVKTKLDQIVDFSGIEHHIDTPVKRYSSGMKVRLGFAVAAHLDPEILVIDEVLAVGDAEFQRRCLGKMKDVSQSGRTVLFVSHNMTAVRSLCSKAMLLDDGRVEAIGGTEEIVALYLGGKAEQRAHLTWDESSAPGNRAVKLREVAVIPDSGQIGGAIKMTEGFSINISYELLDVSERIDFTLQFKGSGGEVMFVSGSGGLLQTKQNIGLNETKVFLPANFFNSGQFEINLLIVKGRKKAICNLDSLICFTVIDEGRETGRWMGRSKGDLFPNFKWLVNE